MFDHLRKLTKNRIKITHRGVAQLVARDVWEQDTDHTLRENKKRRKPLKTLTYSALCSLAKSSVKAV